MSEVVRMREDDLVVLFGEGLKRQFETAADLPGFRPAFGGGTSFPTYFDLVLDAALERAETGELELRVADLGEAADNLSVAQLKALVDVLERVEGGMVALRR